MRGDDLLWDVAMEFGRRLDVGDGVFHLTRNEIFDALRAGFAPHYFIEQRELRYRTEIKLPLPRVIDSEAIERFGALEEVEMNAGAYQALSISGAGAVRKLGGVLDDPDESGGP